MGKCSPLETIPQQLQQSQTTKRIWNFRLTLKVHTVNLFWAFRPTNKLLLPSQMLILYTRVSLSDVDMPDIDYDRINVIRPFSPVSETPTRYPAFLAGTRHHSYNIWPYFHCEKCKQKKFLILKSAPMKNNIPNKFFLAKLEWNLILASQQFLVFFVKRQMFHLFSSFQFDETLRMM